MKIALSSASQPSLSPAELVAHAVAAGYGGIEWRVADTGQADGARGWHYQTNNRCTIAPTAAAMREARRLCEAAGLSIVGLSPYVTVGDLDYGQRMIGLAVEAGTDRVRLWAPRSDEGRYAELFERMRCFLDALLPTARSHGVQLAVEQHQHTICPSISLAMRLAEHYDPAQVRVIYDIGNLAVEGFEAPQISLDLLGRHLAHVQLKNAAMAPRGQGQGWSWAWCPLESGVLPLARIVGLLARRGFDDWLSVEDFSTQRGDAQKLSHNRALVERWFSQACTD